MSKAELTGALSILDDLLLSASALVLALAVVGVALIIVVLSRRM